MDGERIRQVTAILLDNAISMDEADKTRIFERFYRADHARTSKAHFGLGLCIAKEIVELHRRIINVSDTEGGGCTFTVKFPK